MARPHDSGSYSITRAAEADCEAITEIYGEAIEDRVSTFDEFPLAPGRYLRYFQGDARRAILVARQNDTVVGWASVDPISDRHAYRFTALGGLYVARSHRGCGLGHSLIRALDNLAIQLGYHSLIGEILSTNPASLALDLGNGYRVVGEIHEAGFRDDRWIGLIVVQKRLA